MKQSNQTKKKEAVQMGNNVSLGQSTPNACLSPCLLSFSGQIMLELRSFPMVVTCRVLFVPSVVTVPKVRDFVT